MTHARLRRVVAALLLLSLTASCAYYNTFYLARKYYMKATDGQPYEVDRDGTTQRSNYTKSADYSKKMLGVYPKSKYVDDAWLMWARSLVGTDDPLKAVAMLQEFETRFPKSELRPDAEFFLGLAYRMGRKHELAVAAFDEFLAQAPKHPLVPYAFYERSRAFMSLQRYGEAAASAGEVLERFPKSLVADKALRQRAEARFQQHNWKGARADFHVIGDRATTDDERLRYLLREVDCLEADHGFEEARSLLRDARSHVPIPPPLPVMQRVGAGPATPTTPGAPLPNQQPVSVVRTPAEEQYGRLTLRMGDVELLDAQVDKAIELYRSVLHDYPRSQLSAEAQYRVGYAYETGSDDFERARTEYARVREQTGTSQFSQQAQARLDNLDRIDRYRTAAGADSLARKAEGRFLVAEHYLFSLERPDRALEEYRAIYDSSSSATVRARALNAEAWLMSRKLDRKSAADSLFWKVVRDYPATEGQLAARDYLEGEGQVVPESLIVAPAELSKPLVDAPPPLTQPPGTTPRLGAREAAILAPSAPPYGPGLTPPGGPQPGLSLGTQEQWRGSTLTDSLRHAQAQRDSLLRSAQLDTSAAGRTRVDSLRRVISHPDTLGRAALMARIASEAVPATGVVVAPEPASAPKLSAADTLASTHHPILGPPAPGAAVVTSGTAVASRHAPVPGSHSGAAPAQSGTPAATPATGVQRAPVVADSARHAATAAVVDTARQFATAVADTTHHVPAAGADSSASAVRSDSTHKSVLSPKRVTAASVVTPPVATPPVVTPPVESHSKSIVSWDSDQAHGPKLTAAQRDSAQRAQRARKVAVRDSLKHVSAMRDSLKRAAKAAKSKPRSAVPDSTKSRAP